MIGIYLMNWHIFFILLTTFIIPNASGWGQIPIHLTLKQAEDLAIQNNNNMMASLYRLEQGYYGYKASKAFFLPSVTVSSNLGASRDRRGVDCAIQLTQPIFNKVASYQWKESQIQWELLRLDTQQLLCDLLYAVRNTYFSVLLHQAHLYVDEMIIQLWEEEVKRQERLLELGTTIPYELNQAKVHLKGARIDYYSTQSEVKTSQIKLLTTLGLAPNTSIQLLDKEIPLPPMKDDKIDFEYWKCLAFEYRPQLKREQFNLLLTQNRISQTRAERLPTVNIFATAGNDYVYNDFANRTSVGAGVSLDWTIFDPTNRPRLKQAQEGSREAASNYLQVELQTEAAIYDLKNTIEKSYLAYQSAEEGAALADESMRMATKKHQLGMMNSFEYRDAIKTQHQAQEAVIQAKFDVNDSYQQLIQQAGIDLRE